MLGDNTNRIVWVSVIIGLVATVGTLALTLYPEALDEGKTLIVKKIDDFTKDKKTSQTEDVSLSVNIPDQKADMNYYWYNTKRYGDTRTPLFEPNTTGWGEDYERNNDTWHRLFNYSDGVDGWKKSITNSDYVKENFDSVPSEALVSPFEAKDSKGNDITKNIKFKSAKVTKLETWDGKDISTDTDEAYIQWTDSHIPGIQFNHEYSDYKDMLYSIYGYSMTKGWVVKHSNGTIDTTLDAHSWQYAYVSKAYITATYTVSDDSGNSTTKSSSFVVSIDPEYHPDLMF